MNFKKMMIPIFAAVLIGICANFYASQNHYRAGLDAVKVNDIVQSVTESWNSGFAITLPHTEYGYDYAVIDNKESLIAATRSGLSEDIHSAIKNGDIIVDIRLEDQVFGKVIFYNYAAEVILQERNHILIISVATMIVLSLLCAAYTLYIDKSIFRPFYKLQRFARHVAAGNLDIPLEMDKKNLFGAFTESFDLMREELNQARENERQANESKKELVASLSHDIKTPVASIKAVSELMYVKTTDENSKKQLEIIGSKADQINRLVTNLFNATLEEMHELKVTAKEEPSVIVYELVKNADYNHQVHMGDIPECMIWADKQRLEQVIDNVISNSYKYANTAITISSHINRGYLEINIADYGEGVSDDELPLLFHKFYRAENADGKKGAGLGLYISNDLMNKMSGNVECQNTKEGFNVKLTLSLAGKNI